ncbi:hypothetical protein NQZ68_028445 [Dissostichus eleginoides]|nr:hypothetical protein NQZ68_028445 [Dissostichus eleginoides]
MSFCSFFGGEVYKDHFQTGVYVCSKCDHQLFTSRSKYEHSSPWPAFTETIHEDSVSKQQERPGAYKIRLMDSKVWTVDEVFWDKAQSGSARALKNDVHTEQHKQRTGIYVCSECGHKLFSSMSKFEHSTPWPAFSQTIHEDSVTKHPEAWGPLKKRLMDRKVSCEREERFLLLKHTQYHLGANHQILLFTAELRIRKEGISQMVCGLCDDMIILTLLILLLLLNTRRSDVSTKLQGKTASQEVLLEAKKMDAPV